jgi:hypothetical protein
MTVPHHTGRRGFSMGHSAGAHGGIKPARFRLRPRAGGRAAPRRFAVLRSL